MSETTTQQTNYSTPDEMNEEQKAFSYGQQALSKGPSLMAGAGQANFADDDSPF